jgi:Concanavalin A-like lectin/glucanases superfamily
MFRGMLLRRSLLKVGAMVLLLSLVTAAAVLSRSSGRAAAATFGPVAEYSFDEVEEGGGTVEDDSGNKHTATIHGAEWTPHGRYGGAMEFDGAKDDYLSIAASEELDRTGEEFTIEAWVRPTGSSNRETILEKERGGGGPKYSYGLFLHHEEPLGYFMGSEVGLLEGDEDAVPLDSWTHIAITDDGGFTRLYVDGEIEDTSPAVAVEGDGELRIGGNGIAGEYFTGRIDEVRIYERALSAAEVGTDMETPIATPKAGPVAEYSFDGLAEGAETVEDHSGNGHTATIHGAKPVPNGRYGGAMEFKEGEYLSVPSSPELDLTEEFTLEAWIHPETRHEFDDILSKETTEVKDPSHAAYLIADHHGQFATYYGEYENAYYSPGEEIPTHTWTHVAVVDDGARIHLFLNGQEVESGPAFPIISTEGGELRIGSSRTLGEENDFIGRIDEVRIYGRALNGTEVGADMETPIQTPKAGPVAAYSFDEGVIGTEGGTVEDVTGHEHTATLEGGAVRVKGRYGDALHFREEGDCATVPDSPELRLSEEFTLEAWVWSEGGLYEDPIVVREAGGKGIFGIGIGSREEGEAEGFIGEGKSSKAAIGGGEIVRENTWVHIATTYDGAKLRLYVDGELVATKSATTPPATGAGSLRIGCDGPDGPFGGRIDEVRLYGRALNGPEVDSDMESPLQTPKRTPVAEYSFDEKNEETAPDITGDGHTATVEGAKWTEHGKYGGAMEFNAAEDDILKIPASAELDFDEEFTLEAWVRPSGEDNHDAPLIDKQEGSGRGYFLYEGGSVSDRPYGAANEEQELIHAEDPLSAHTWSHVALTFSGNRTYLYVNGELVDNGAAEPTVTSEGELEIGGSTDTADYFDGRIDEVRIYNRELDQAEVDYDMEAPIQTPQHGPIAAWSFEEGKGATVEDVTGDGHEGTIEGAQWVRGKYGEALKFDGEGDAVKVPNSPDFDLTEGFTIESWVRPESASSEWAPILAKEIGGGKAAHELAWWLYEGGSSSNVPSGGTEPTPGKRSEATAEDPLPVDVWSHVALTYDGSQVRLYVDGELVDYSSVPAGPPPVTEGELQIGAATEHDDDFAGRLDEVKIYNRALNAAEIVSSMGPLPQVETGEIYGVNESEAILGGDVNPMGSEVSVSYEYGPTTSYGSVYPTSPEEVEEWMAGDTWQEVEQGIFGLDAGTTYHFRLVATSPLVRVVGKDQTFTTDAAEFRPAIKPKEFSGRVGVNWSGSPQTFTSRTDMGYVSESGAKIFRVVINPPFGGTEAQREAQQFRNDNLFEFMTEHEVEILPDVVGIPGMGSTAGNKLPPIGPGSLARDRWTAGLEYLVKRYGPEGKFWKAHPTLEESKAPVVWEIWNEENEEKNADFQYPGEKAKTGKTGEVDPARYGELLELSHQILENVNKSVSPNMKVLFGGLLTGPRHHRKPPESHMKVGAFIRRTHHSEDYAVMGVHPYAFKGGVQVVTQKVKSNIFEARTALNSVGGSEKKIWITELGWPVGGENDGIHVPAKNDKSQSELLESSFNMMKSVSGDGDGEFNIGNIFWYNIENWDNSKNPASKNPAPEEWAAHCGLVLEGGTHRSAFKVFKEEAE